MKYSADELEMLVEEYLAGRLAGDSLAAFEHAIREHREIAETVALQREVDGLLRSAFVPPHVPARNELIESARQTSSSNRDSTSPSGLKIVGTEESEIPPRRSLKHRWTWMAIAAAVMLTAAGVFRSLLGGDDFRLVPPDQLYAFLQNSGWKPAQVCNTPNEFAALVKSRLGEGLLPDMAAAASNGVALLGWGYENDYDGSPLSKKTMMLLTNVQGERVLVLIDQKQNRRDLHVRAGSTLNIIEREKGSLIVYEVTPAKEARVLPLLKSERE